MRLSSIYYQIAIFTVIHAAANGQTAPTGTSPPYPWEGEVTAANVYVRSGAGSNWYPTTKVNSGDRVVVLGEKFGWYQVAPVPGSFSYVDIAMVDRAAGAKKGTIKQDKVYIRAGSQLESRKNSTQVVLNKGDAVEILGEADGFFKITPPPGASLYVSKQYVRPVDARLRSGMVERHLTNQPRSLPNEKPVDIPPSPVQPADTMAAGNRAKSATDTPDKVADATKPTGNGVPIPIGDSPPVKSANTGSTTSQPTDASMAGRQAMAANSDDPASADGMLMEPEPLPGDLKKTDQKVASGTKPSTKKVDVPAGQPRKTPDRFKTMLTVLESELVSMLAKPFDEQESEPLRKKYEEIANQSEEYVPSEIAKIRVRQLSDRATLKLARKDLNADAESIAVYRANMDQERMKILRRKITKAMEKFELEGELWRSHAFSPESRRFRLVDPSTKSTVAYVDIPVGVDPNPDHLIGRLVGINSRTQKFSPSARVPIAEAREVVDLSIRNAPPPADAGNHPTDLDAGANIPSKEGNSLSSAPRVKNAGEPSVAATREPDDDRLP